MDECKLLPSSTSPVVVFMVTTAFMQGLTLVHFSAQRKRILWDRECIQGLFRGVFRGCQGVLAGGRVYFVSETAQVELRRGRV